MVHPRMGAGMSDGMPKVLVLLAAYNGMQWLAEQVASILHQTDVEVGLWVSVDVSCDGTEAWFDTLAVNDARVHLLPHGHRFGAAAPNFFRLIRDVPVDGFDYVAFADQDDIWSAAKLSRAVEVLKQKDAYVYSGNVLAIWPNGRQQLVKKSYPQRKWDFLFEAAGPGCTYVFRSDCFRDLQRFVQDAPVALNRIAAHDWFCYAFARNAGYRWFIDPKPMMLYRQHAVNHLGVNSGWRAFHTRLRLFLQGQWLDQSRLIASLLGISNAAFVEAKQTRGKAKSYLFLARKSFSLRRRPRDAFFIGCMLVMMAAATLVR